MEIESIMEQMTKKRIMLLQAFLVIAHVATGKPPTCFHFVVVAIFPAICVFPGETGLESKSNESLVVLHSTLGT